MQPQLLIVLLAAAASARPVPNASHEHAADIPRELQYSDIAKLHGDAPEWRRPHGPARTYDSGHERYEWEDPREPHELRHPGPPPPPPFDMWRSRGPPPPPFDARGPPPPPPHPRVEVVDNILEFLSHQARSVPEVSSRIVNGIVEFLSHETRSLPEEHQHEPSVVKKILDFLAEAAK